MKSRSIKNSHFSYVPQIGHSRSRFQRNFSTITSFNSGLLIPWTCQEVLPNDTVSIKTSALVRMATPIVPLMSNASLKLEWFYVPSRLIWDHFIHMMGQQDDPDDSIDYSCPTITFPDGVEEQSIFDYMGIPLHVKGLTVNSLPFRAYNKIYNDWYRDENLQDRVSHKTDDTPDSPADFKLMRRRKVKDYFTSMLPWPQKFEPSAIPILGGAPVVGNGMSLGLNYGNKNTALLAGTDANTVTALGHEDRFYGYDAGLRSSRPDVPKKPNDGEYYSVGVTTDPAKSGLVLGEGGTAVTINDLRRAVLIQRINELYARSGSMYFDSLQSEWGAYNPDGRLQRSEYLGNGVINLYVDPVQQTSSTDTTSPQGNLGATGTFAGQDDGFTRSFIEHGYLIGICTVVAEHMYQQGLNRMFSRMTRFDYASPLFSGLGEQAVLNKELYCQGSEVLQSDGKTPVDDGVAGYQERFAEYKYAPSTVTGKMRSTAATPLDKWHLAQDFKTLPVLNSAFITEDAPWQRVIAVTDEPEFLANFYVSAVWDRVLPVYCVPGMGTGL